MDGNALFHSLIKVPETFGEVAQNVFTSLPQVSKVHFLTEIIKMSQSNQFKEID